MQATVKYPLLAAVIAEIEKTGLTKAAIGRLAGRDGSAATRWAKGTHQPAWSAAKALADAVRSAGHPRATGEARLAEIAAELAEAGRESVLAPLIASDDVAAAWARLDVSLKRAAVGALMTVTLVPPGRGAHKWDPERVVRVKWVTGAP